MFFSQNLKFLRKRRRLTQEDLADMLGMKRPTLGGYENQVASPGIDALITFSDFFKISIDTLLKVDLSKLSERQMGEIERGHDVFVRGTQLRVLTTTVDRRNRENIEMVPEKAKAGYTGGYADPEYLRELPVFQLPFLSTQKKYRCFQISGDSMLPIPHNAWVTAEFVQNWETLENDQAYIILTADEGIVFKMVKNHIAENKTLWLYSINTLYEPYALQVNDIREVWKFVLYFCPEIPEPQATRDELMDAIRGLKTEMGDLKNKISKNV